MKKVVLCLLLLFAPPGSTEEAAQPLDARTPSEQDNEQPPVAVGNPVDSAPESSLDNALDSTDGDPDKQAPTPEGAQPSPFDYNPSEEISEDLSVSFPVDI